MVEIGDFPAILDFPPQGSGYPADPSLLLGNLLQHFQGGPPSEASDAGVEGHQVGSDGSHRELLEKLQGLVPLATWQRNQSCGDDREIDGEERS